MCARMRWWNWGVLVRNGIPGARWRFGERQIVRRAGCRRRCGNRSGSKRSACPWRRRSRTPRRCRCRGRGRPCRRQPRRPNRRRHVHIKDRLGGIAARLVLLRQPDLEALAFQETREFDVETLLGQGEQRTGEIDFRHGLLRIDPALRSHRTRTIVLATPMRPSFAYDTAVARMKRSEIRGTASQLECCSRITLRSIRATTTKEKMKRNADRRVQPTSAPIAHKFTQSAQTICWRGAACNGTRSPIGVPPRLLPSGLSALGRSSRPGFLGRGRTFDPVSSRQPGSEDLAFLRGRCPRPPVPVQGTHLPDRS